METVLQQKPQKTLFAVLFKKLNISPLYILQRVYVISPEKKKNNGWKHSSRSNFALAESYNKRQTARQQQQSLYTPIDRQTDRQTDRDKNNSITTFLFLFYFHHFFCCILSFSLLSDFHLKRVDHFFEIFCRVESFQTH